MLKHKSFVLFSKKKPTIKKQGTKTTPTRETKEVISGHYDTGEAISLSLSNDFDNEEDIYDDYELEESFSDYADELGDSTYIEEDYFSDANSDTNNDIEDEDSYSDANAFFVDEAMAKPMKHESSPKKDKETAIATNQKRLNELAVFDKLEDTTEEDKKFENDVKAIMSGKKIFDNEKIQNNPKEASKYKNHGLKDKSVKDVADKMKAEHAIFDKIAQSMDMANSYDLGTIAMAKKFDELEKDTNDVFNENVKNIINKEKPTKQELIDKKSVNDTKEEKVLTEDFLTDIDKINKKKFTQENSIEDIDIVSYAKADECRDTWDPISNKRIQKLHTAIQCKSRNFINEVENTLGIKLRVTSGYRSFIEQTSLYNQGRTTAGKIVTNAKAGQSYHNYGLAIDVCEIKENKALWDEAMFKKIAPIGKKYEFEWGGDWKKFVDRPHFQYTNGKSTSELLKLYNANEQDYTKIEI